MAKAQEYDALGRRVRWDAPASERFGVSPAAFASTTNENVGGGGDDVGGGLQWQTPAGWVERPAAQFREANFYVAGDQRAECYLTTLVGEAGGLAANINRWRTQVSLPPLGEAEIAMLPKMPWFGGQAVFIDFAGHWTGMSGDQSEQDWRLVGLLLMQPDQSRFLKMVGPSVVLDREIEAFRALAASLKAGSGASRSSAGNAPPITPGANLPPDHPPIGGAPPPPIDPSAKLPDDHPPIGGKNPMVAETIGDAPATDTMRNASLEWSAPKGWRRGPEKTMREVTYLVGENPSLECYVTLLAGDGGGTLANINRWCGQMGAPELDEAALAKLERVPMAGGEGVVVQISRGSDSDAAQGHDLLLGAVSMLEQRALFVKLTGPRSAVEAQHAAFVEFSKSLKAVR